MKPISLDAHRNDHLNFYERARAYVLFDFQRRRVGLLQTNTWQQQDECVSFLSWMCDAVVGWELAQRQSFPGIQ